MQLGVPVVGQGLPLDVALYVCGMPKRARLPSAHTWRSEPDLTDGDRGYLPRAALFPEFSFTNIFAALLRRKRSCLLGVQPVMICRGGLVPVVLSMRFDKKPGMQNGNMFILTDAGWRRLYCGNA